MTVSCGMAKPIDFGDPALPVAGQGALSSIRKSRRAKWRAAVLIGVHIAIAALVGALLMVLTGCLTVRRAHDAVNWPVLIFIAGALALSEGAKKSGANQALADVITHGFGDLAPTEEKLRSSA